MLISIFANGISADDKFVIMFSDLQGGEIVFLMFYVIMIEYKKKMKTKTETVTNPEHT